MSPAEVTDIVQYLVPEIFLPNDTIIQHGSYATTMYFLASGTVAVYTSSGKEICHLCDGDYFGEVSLLNKGQTRTATVVAIETCQLYRLEKNSFEKCLLKNRRVIDKMLNEAKIRIKETTMLDERYKKMLFEKTFQAT
ncbi:hypothetical protein NQ317_007280 [Molorchus minor]|uniref:Cyclic nucleotide-binding domain-containing protein n=1 Tax=Molorchus minor TaxID=1323400 RepID=A0ABQ9JU89_9CUCU|nr:hypothetical protein NQ317_007280 [Molorchus minor]